MSLWGSCQEEMAMFINWDETFSFNPHTLQPDTHGGIPFPSYGLYGGPGISGPGTPVDALDAVFAAHDAAYAINPVAANLQEISAIHNLEITHQLEDAEAVLYAGIATLGAV